MYLFLLLGELQFAFVCFLLGNVYEGFEHWKSLLTLLCRSEETMRKRKELYLGLIAVLYHQLGEVPPDFFVDIVSQNNFLTSTLQVEDTSILLSFVRSNIWSAMYAHDNCKTAPILLT